MPACEYVGVTVALGDCTWLDEAVLLRVPEVLGVSVELGDIESLGVRTWLGVEVRLCESDGVCVRLGVSEGEQAVFCAAIAIAG